MTKKRLIPLILMTILVVVLFVFFRESAPSEESNILIKAQRGEFVIDITTTGELEAKKSVKIYGPTGLRRFGIYEVNLQHIIEEGTIVQKGQNIARLDPTPLANKIQDATIEFEKAELRYTHTRLDTTLQMREARDKLINLKYAAEQKKLEWEQSQYEPPATIKTKEIEYQKSLRALNQESENLKIKRQQNIAKIREVSANLRKRKIQLDGLGDLKTKFNIKAPENGMLIYYKGWNGVIKSGSKINSWDPVVATLPDLSKMLSNTYVNEVDIRKIKKGQVVEIGLDAFPNKKLTGKVIKVANVGEQRPNSDAKVFLVSVEINESDKLLRPAMTTSNRITTKKVDNAIYVPLECLHVQNDSITYVFKKEGLSIIKQEVRVGDTNDSDAVILTGLKEGDDLYLSRVKDVRDDDIRLLADRE